MLETVKSRQLYGFLILTVLPVSFGIGYYLKDRKDSQILEQVTSISSAARAAGGSNRPPPLIAEERIKMLRRREMELERERKDVLEKIKRMKGRE